MPAYYSTSVPPDPSALLKPSADGQQAQSLSSGILLHYRTVYSGSPLANYSLPLSPFTLFFIPPLLRPH